MRTLDVFTGIGGATLGLERAGFTAAGFCESDPFCRAVLAKHWPDVWQHDDIRTLTGELVRERCGHVDALVGGPPCQPASTAGRRRGTADDRWLWPEFLRLARELHPRLVLAENPLGILSLHDGRAFDSICAALEQEGYAVGAFVVGAEAVGAPHRRERVFIVAHAEGRRGEARPVEHGETPGERRPDALGCGEAMDNSASDRCGLDRRTRESFFPCNDAQRGSEAVPDAERDELRQEQGLREPGRTGAAELGDNGTRWPARRGEPQHAWEEPRTTQRALGVAAHGPTARLVRSQRRHALRALGNAITPQQAEVVGRAVMAMLQDDSTRRSDLLNHLRGQATNRAAGDLAMKQFTGTDAE